MKKITTIFAAAGLFTVGLVACQKKEDVTIISPIAGDFLGHEACPANGTPSASAYSVTIYNQSDTGNGKVFIRNIYGIGGTYEGTVNGNTITVTSTPYVYTSGTTTYRGNISATGTVDGPVLTLNFKLDGPLADDCQFVGSRDARH